ncbi:type IV pilin N-terminal domain-containing protein [Methanospirillum sp.]|uniref:type IV pilin N-terminal domain-containing protein n=1 Tax=Methanospirillum sp. TaxID=45200 RepID=UPI0035A042F2
MSGKKNDAVSPVIGIMLMLVVTILIAAVVSTFAGGIADTKSKTPVATISGEYSQSRGMIIYHNGGDVLSPIDIEVVTQLTRVWGPASDSTTYYANKSVMDTNGTIWAPVDKQYITKRAFQPGESIYIAPENLGQVQCNVNYASPLAKTSASSYQNSVNVGRPFIVKIIDKNANQVIGQTEVTIQS